MSAFGIVLKELRTKSGMSQQELAEIIGITKSVISYYERSERAPSSEVLIKLAGTFQVTTDYLLGLETRIFLDVSDLSADEVRLLESMANALRKKNRGTEEEK